MIEKEYLSKNHSKFLLKYHVIFVCKYRRKLLYGNVDAVMKNIFFDIANKADFKIEVMETDKDHIHLLVSSEPNLTNSPEAETRIHHKDMEVVSRTPKKMVL